MQFTVLEITRETEAVWAKAWRDQDAMFSFAVSYADEIVQHITDAKREASK